MEFSRNLRSAFFYAKCILPVLGLFVGIYFLIQIFPWFLLPVFAVMYVFTLLCIVCIIDITVRRKFYAEQFKDDLGLARHIFVVWFFIAPFLQIICLWLLQIPIPILPIPYLWELRAYANGRIPLPFNLSIPTLKKLTIHKNGKIPKGKWIGTGNHPDEYLSDVILVPIASFSLKWRYLLNPLKWFPRTFADVQNYGKTTFFSTIIGDRFLIHVDRGNGSGNGEGLQNSEKRQSIIKSKKSIKHFRENEGILLSNIEGRRTTTALNAGEFDIKSIGEDILVMGKPEDGTAWLSKFTNAPVVPYYIQIRGGELDRIKDFLADRNQGKITENFFNNPKASIGSGFQRLLQLFRDPKITVSLEIGLPLGPLIPLKEESREDYTQRIYRAIFEVGEIQLRRSKKTSKFRLIEHIRRKCKKFFQQLL